MPIISTPKLQRTVRAGLQGSHEQEALLVGLPQALQQGNCP